MNELQQLVLRQLEALGVPGQPLSYKAAALRSRGRVTHETIRSIAIGQHTNRITDKTAEGLATALEVPIADVYKAAQAPRPGARWRWPERFDRLTEEERRIVENVAGGFLAAYERGQRGD